MSIDPHPIRAFLEPSHAALFEKAQAFGRDVLAVRPRPETDAEARTEARELLTLAQDTNIERFSSFFIGLSPTRASVCVPRSCL